MVQPLWKKVWWFSTNLIILLPHDLSGIYSEELKTYGHTKTFTWMLIVTLFITAKTWKQPTCPSVGEWISKLW